MAMELNPISSAGEQTVGADIEALVGRLYPICRSITGDGVRKTLSILSEHIAIRRIEIPTGMEVFDWTIPEEWNIRDAYIADLLGRRIVDFGANSLHVVSYSVPVHQIMSMSELRPHLHILPDQPDLIPYRTSYYNRNWGFCLSRNQLEAMGDGPFEVRIDATLEPGSLTIGEIFIPGEIAEEILISTHICHPSMANDNCSGLAIAAFIAARAERAGLRHSLRVLFVPGTIGSLAWLALNDAETWRIAHGLVITGLGDRGDFTYKRSRLGNARIDRAAVHVLSGCGGDPKIIDFSPWGYDERQYCSPGLNLPVGRLTRSPHGEFPEYHSSADDLTFVSAEALEEALVAIEDIIAVIDQDRTYRSTNQKGEPRLGKYGLYRTVAGQSGKVPEMAMLWVLNLSDGRNSLLDIAQRSGQPFSEIKMAADALHGAGLLEDVSKRAG
jgi:aminopeptidase-like protein